VLVTFFLYRGESNCSLGISGFSFLLYRSKGLRFSVDPAEKPLGRGEYFLGWVPEWPPEALPVSGLLCVLAGFPGPAPIFPFPGLFFLFPSPKPIFFNICAQTYDKFSSFYFFAQTLKLPHLFFKMECFFFEVKYH
jgi:hypothetical protein